MIQLRQYTDSDYTVLNSYQLDAQQARFTADIDYCVNRRKDLQDADKTVVVIVYLDEPVGFFVLDCGEVIQDLTDNPKAVAIRSLSINPDYQGKGLGTQAMRLVPDFLREHLPTIDEIVLSVNAKNAAAYHVYRQSGYVDTGRMIDGLMGKQHVMSRAITLKRLLLTETAKTDDLAIPQRGVK